VKKYLSIGLAGLLCFPLVACGTKEETLPETGLVSSNMEIDELDPYETLPDGTYPYEVPKADGYYDENNENIQIAQGEEFYSGIQTTREQGWLGQILNIKNFNDETQVKLAKDLYTIMCTADVSNAIFDTWFVNSYGEEKYFDFKDNIITLREEFNLPHQTQAIYAKQLNESEFSSHVWDFVEPEVARLEQNILELGEQEAFRLMNLYAEDWCYLEASSFITAQRLIETNTIYIP